MVVLEAGRIVAPVDLDPDGLALGRLGERGLETIDRLGDCGTLLVLAEDRHDHCWTGATLGAAPAPSRRRGP